MPELKLKLRGAIPANLMPFKSDLSIDEVQYRRHMRWLADVPGRGSNRVQWPCRRGCFAHRRRAEARHRRGRGRGGQQGEVGRRGLQPTARRTP